MENTKKPIADLFDPVFVVYHTALSKDGLEKIANIYKEDPEVKWKERWLTFAENFLPFVSDYISALFDSIRHVYPQGRLIVLTDEKTELKLDPQIEQVRYPLDPNKPAFMRLKAQIRYLEELKTACDVLFLDYDMLLQRPLSVLSHHDFDVALMYEYGKNRVEGSFILISKKAIAHGITFLKEVEACFHAKFFDYEAWGGIEAAMNEATSLPSLSPGQTTLLKRSLTSIRLFPAHEYSYPISDRDTQMGIEYLPEKMLLHFRGINKSDMLDYWKTYLKDPS